MKEIIAIIRPRKVSSTKEALDALGYPSITATAVLGRGKQRGIANEVSFPVDPALRHAGKSLGMKFIPKRYIFLVDKSWPRCMNSYRTRQKKTHRLV